MTTQILLLPRQNYWEWVSASQNFVLKFDINLTPDPEVAGRHAYPGQTITVANASAGYPSLGSIEAWFASNYPEAKLDLISTTKAAELREIFTERILREDPLGEKSNSIQVWQADWFTSEPIKLLWPTDYPMITQSFGVNPEIYAYWGLPGHEGLDIRAPFKSNVYACADGEVYVADDNESGAHPYGSHVRIRHANGYRTIYGHLAKILVRKGKEVKAGERIALSGASGTTTAATLHLTLKREGAREQGFTHFPNDAIDPTPFLQYPNERTVPADYAWPQAKALAGVNVNPKGSISERELQTLNKTRMQAIKIPAIMVKSEVARIKQHAPELFILTHLHNPEHRGELDPKTWLASMRPRVKSHYSAGLRYFEIHRAPNIFDEGCFSQWHSGYDFSKWFMDVFMALKEEFPEANFGFPGLSMGKHINGKRIAPESFLEGTDEAIELADWLGLQSYWSSEEEYASSEQGSAFRAYRSKYQGKLLFVSEFANVNAQASPSTKAEHYNKLYNDIEHLPGIGAAFAQVLSSSSAYSNLAWHSENGDANQLSIELGKLRNLATA